MKKQPITQASQRLLHCRAFYTAFVPLFGRVQHASWRPTEWLFFLRSTEAGPFVFILHVLQFVAGFGIAPSLSIFDEVIEVFGMSELAALQVKVSWPEKAPENAQRGLRRPPGSLASDFVIVPHTDTWLGKQTKSVKTALGLPLSLWDTVFGCFWSEPLVPQWTSKIPPKIEQSWVVVIPQTIHNHPTFHPEPSSRRLGPSWMFWSDSQPTTERIPMWVWRRCASLLKHRSYPSQSMGHC